VPEAHIVSIVLGALLHLARPWPVGLRRGPRLAFGAVCGASGILLAGWATSAAGWVNIEDPDRVLVAGPYRFTRNPMYLGWALLHLGSALLANSRWMLLSLPLVLRWMHSEVRREERALESRFGGEYRRYALRVPRYLIRTPKPEPPFPGRRKRR
jgi:protein-S-isoprenylcysteine O-methyltransferase Ste14